MSRFQILEREAGPDAGITASLLERTELQLSSDKSPRGKRDVVRGGRS